MSRILIAGCGKIGTNLGLRLVERDHEVWGLRRQADKIPLPIKPLEADLLAPRTLEIIPQRLDWIFIILTADRFDDDSYKKSYLECTRNLLTILTSRRERPMRIFFTSSTSVYGQTNGEWVDETSPTIPNHFSGRRILETERLLRDSSFPNTCVRLAGIYGPDRTGFIDRVISGKISCAPDPVVYRNLIHCVDLIGILIHLMSLQHPDPLYNGVDSEPVSNFDLVQWVCGRLGISNPERNGPSSLHSTRSTSNKRCSSHRLIQSGYTFKYPTFRYGYGEIIDDLKNR